MKKAVAALLAVLLGLFFFVQAVTHQPYKGFVVTKKVELARQGCTLVELTHTKTGASVVHIQNDDPENFFAICFRTLPTKSNGVAHIVEHSVFQGSEKYPVKSLFFHMNKRSLATFMNAFTGQEYTCYPAASQNRDDFYNLLSVYADAVFHPLLKPSCFAQEGYRLEFETFDDPKSPLCYRGVVYNEMKGALSSPQTRMAKCLHSALYPDAMGDVFAGGDPDLIPTLSYEEFVAFHKEHYYPGNSLFFFYGNLPLDEHLTFLEQHVLKGFDYKPPVAKRPTQPHFTSPRLHEYSSAGVDEPLVTINWLTKSTPSDDEFVALAILDHILMSSDAAPLKHALLHSGLCKAVDSGLEAAKEQVPYLLYFEGIDLERVQELEAFVQQQLHKIADEGISQEVLERSLARIELDESDLKRGSGPVGLTLLQTAGLRSLVGYSLERSLQLVDELDSLRDRCRKDPHYMSRLIHKHFLDNSHRVVVVLRPAEQEPQKELPSNLSQEDVKKILAMSREVREAAYVADDMLPEVGVDNISKEIEPLATICKTEGAISLYHYPVFTNHITYAACEFLLPQLAEDELWLASLYAYLLPQLGVEGRSYKENIAYCNEHTGGLSCDVRVHNSRAALSLSAKVLDRKQELLFDLFYDTLMTCDFTDSERIKKLLVKHALELKSSLQHNALEYATLQALSASSVDNRLKNCFNGLEYALQVIKAVERNELDQLIAKLQKRFIPHDGLRLIVASDQEPSLGKLKTLTCVPATVWEAPVAPLKSLSCYHPINAQVAFSACGFCTEQYNPYLLLAQEILSYKVLQPRVREEGGAYGAGASYNPVSGTFTLRSYRDPNIASTQQAFEDAVKLLVDGQFDERDVKRAILGVMQHIDRPLHPAKKASMAYQFHFDKISDETRREFRSKLLSATVADIQQAAAQCLSRGLSEGVFVTLAPLDLIEEENKKLKTPLVDLSQLINY